MPHDDQLFTPDEVDEQIDWLERASGAQPPTPNTQVIRGLHRLYENEQADAQSADVVWQRLLERGAVPGPQPQRTRRSGLLPRQRKSEPLPLVHVAETPARRGLSTRLLTIAAAVLLVVVVGGLVAGLVLVRQRGPNVAIPPQSGIAYIGSDGNVWEMTWPGGTPKQLTTDAQANGITYEGLSWSPDGSKIAVARFDQNNPPQGSELVVLALDGKVVMRVGMEALRYDAPLAWSPDSSQIAYRAESSQTSFENPVGAIVLVDAQTGQTVKTLTYTSNQGGCGGGGYPPLKEAILLAHHSNRLDTFVWSPDGQNILVSQGCNDDAAEAVNVHTGAQTPNFPIGAHYQPGGNLLLGLWSDGTLGLTDFSANPVRSLLQAPLTVPGYDISLGASSWSPGGKVVYFEHNNGIWRVNDDGSGAQQLIAGTADDAQMNATAVFAPSLSPDGKLLYAQAQGSDNPDTAGTSQTPATQWYIAQADGSHPQPLPQGISDVVWRPGN
ncbi:MAG TPA: hypothetical protein VFU32_10465 [Ktedonobacterales bacterium]|nr:hypothetical protein [Ktedonobacterales bacterium]